MAAVDSDGSKTLDVGITAFITGTGSWGSSSSNKSKSGSNKSKSGSEEDEEDKEAIEEPTFDIEEPTFDIEVPTVEVDDILANNPDMAEEEAEQIVDMIKQFQSSNFTMGFGGFGGSSGVYDEPNSKHCLQPYVTVNFEIKEEGTPVTVKDSEGNVIHKHSPRTDYAVVFFTSPKIVLGETYTLVAGDETQTAVAQIDEPEEIPGTTKTPKEVEEETPEIPDEEETPEIPDEIEEETPEIEDKVPEVPVEDEEENKNILKIMTIGDSITYGLAEAGGYRKYLDYFLKEKGYSHIEFVGPEGQKEATFTYNGETVTYDDNHAGYSGYTIKQLPNSMSNKNGLLEVLQRKNTIKKYKPDIVLLLIGTNDVVLGSTGITEDFSVAGSEENLHSLLDYILEDLPSNSKLFIGSIPEYALFGGDPELIAEYNETVEKVANEYAKSGNNVEFADVHGCLDGVNDLSTDQIHPSSTGYEKIGKFWAKVIDNYIKNELIIKLIRF